MCINTMRWINVSLNTAPWRNAMNDEPHAAYKDKGLTGLANMGNTCYVNACLQLLSHTYEFNDFLSKNGGEYKSRLNHKVDSVLLHEWDKLRAMMWTKSSGDLLISVHVPLLFFTLDVNDVYDIIYNYDHV